MADNVIHDLGPEIARGAVEVSGHILGRGLINGFRKSFLTSSQKRQGDSLMDQSRELLQKNLPLLNRDEQDTIQRQYKHTRLVKKKLEDHSGSRIQRLFQAREYRREAKVTFMITKVASDRAVDDDLMDRIDQARCGPGGGFENNAGMGHVSPISESGNPFTDSHAPTPRSTDVSVNDQNDMEMSTLQNEDTGEAFLSDRTNGEASQSVSPGATGALSLHKEDESTPHLVTTPLHNVGQGR